MNLSDMMGQLGQLINEHKRIANERLNLFFSLLITFSDTLGNIIVHHCFQFML